MSSYSPPLSTGLTAPDIYPEEQLSPFVDDLGETHSPGVYAIRLSRSDDSLEVAWSEEFDAMHPEIDAMERADRLYYIGAAKDVLERVSEHAAGHKTASVMQVCPPHSVAEVWWYDSADAAFLAESRHAIEWGNRDGVYVVQN